MWILLLTAIHISNVNDIPATITMEFPTEQQCLAAAETLKYKIKINSYKIEPSCYLKK
jgi:hypothetical protein